MGDVLPSQGKASLFLYPIPRKGHQQHPLEQCSLAPRALCEHQALSASALLSPNPMSSSSSGAREWDLGANSSTVQRGAHCNAGWDSVLFSSAIWRGRRQERRCGVWCHTAVFHVAKPVGVHSLPASSSSLLQGSWPPHSIVPNSV